MAEQKQYDNELKGALFVNDKRGDDPKAPVARGNVQVNGKKYNVSAFARTIKKDGPRKGQKFWSLVLQEDGPRTGDEERSTKKQEPTQRELLPEATPPRSSGHEY